MSATPKPKQSRQPTAHAYCRISHPDQRKGGGLERQTKADLGTFCQQFGLSLSKTILVDDGVSAFRGLNATPDHELGKFLLAVRRGDIPAGDCLLLENYDRLSRRNPWAAIALVSELRDLGIHIGRLDRMKLLRCDSEEYGDFFEAAIEFMRGNSESSVKSKRNGDAWRRKREAARASGQVITRKLPAWIEERDGKLELIPDRVAILRRIFSLAGRGHGPVRIVRTLTEEGVAGIGPAGHWSRSYIGLLLRDRRVLGEFQPRRIDGQPDGEPIPDYYPRAISDQEWYAVRRGTQTPRGQVGQRVELFSGLMRDARTGESYLVVTRSERGKNYRALANSGGIEGRTAACSFPLDTFEPAVLSELKEIDPREILEIPGPGDDVQPLRDELAGVKVELSAATAWMDEAGFSPTVAKRIKTLEARVEHLAERLRQAEREVSCPLREEWEQVPGLVEALAAAGDPAEARLRLRAVLQRIVERIYLLVVPVPKGESRWCAVQIWFAAAAAGEEGKHRDYLIRHRYGRYKRPAIWAVRSFADAGLPGNLDLRNPVDVAKLERDLQEMEGGK